MDGTGGFQTADSWNIGECGARAIEIASLFREEGETFLSPYYWPTWNRRMQSRRKDQQRIALSDRPHFLG